MISQENVTKQKSVCYKTIQNKCGSYNHCVITCAYTNLPHRYPEGYTVIAQNHSIHKLLSSLTSKFTAMWLGKPTEWAYISQQWTYFEMNKQLDF